jgi:uncharacterized protein CbrC (UPF0167 family)
VTNLYTISVSFSDHLVGMDQIEADTPEKAVEEFIRTAECFDRYDREMLIKHTNPLLHVSGNAGSPKRHKGVWILSFSYHEVSNIQWPDDNPVPGGQVIQTDPNGPTREPKLTGFDS